MRFNNNSKKANPDGDIWGALFAEVAELRTELHNHELTFVERGYELRDKWEELRNEHLRLTESFDWRSRDLNARLSRIGNLIAKAGNDTKRRLEEIEKRVGIAEPVVAAPSPAVPRVEPAKPTAVVMPLAPAPTTPQ